MHVTVQVVNPDDALRAIYLIKKKMVVADGRVEKDQYEKSQTVSPTISNDTLLIVDTHEGIDVAVVDAVSADLKADFDYYTLLKFTGCVR